MNSFSIKNAIVKVYIKYIPTLRLLYKKNKNWIVQNENVLIYPYPKKWIHPKKKKRIYPKKVNVNLH